VIQCVLETTTGIQILTDVKKELSNIFLVMYMTLSASKSYVVGSYFVEESQAVKICKFNPSIKSNKTNFVATQ